jgi:mannobiose 2-epimerase
MRILSENYPQEIAQELQNILNFWLENAIDEPFGGFIGKMDSTGVIHPYADKGGVLNARILWTFSAAFNHTPQSEYLAMAHRSYQYIRQFFDDNIYGGVYWAVDYQGNPTSTRKQIYGQAFMIYALSEYYRATQNPEALTWAIELFELIEKYSFDTQQGGYWEAFSQDWTLLDDLRLSEKDRNDPKTMNTHLHILEAYANLYRVWPDSQLTHQIKQLLAIFAHKIIDSSTWHMKLFFDKNWQAQSAGISYGHDIEAAWLLLEAAEVLHDEALIAQFKAIAVTMANASAEGIQPDGSMIHEFDPTTQHYDTHREWWVEAEGMVGFLNAYQITKEEHFLQKIQGLWLFTQKYLIDQERGEWIWGVFDDYSPMNSEDKMGFWKCPYHNARACIEILNRI